MSSLIQTGSGLCVKVTMYCTLLCHEWWARCVEKEGMCHDGKPAAILQRPLCHKRGVL